MLLMTIPASAAFPTSALRILREPCVWYIVCRGPIHPSEIKSLFLSRFLSLLVFSLSFPYFIQEGIKKNMSTKQHALFYL